MCFACCFLLCLAGCWVCFACRFDLSLVLGALLADQVLGLPGCFAGCWVLPFLWGCLSVSAENHAAKPINGLLSGFSGLQLPVVHRWALCDCGRFWWISGNLWGFTPSYPPFRPLLMALGDQIFSKIKRTPPVNFFRPPFFLAGLFLNFWQVFSKKKTPVKGSKFSP